MNSIPTELWEIVRQYTDQMIVVAQLRNEVDNMTNNFEFMVDDNIRLNTEMDQLNERIAVLERLNLMYERQSARQRRQLDVLRNRIDVLESTQKRRRIGETLNRMIEYESTADMSSDSDVTVIELSDTEEVDV